MASSEGELQARTPEQTTTCMSVRHRHYESPEFMHRRFAELHLRNKPSKYRALVCQAQVTSFSKARMSLSKSSISLRGGERASSSNVSDGWRLTLHRAAPPADTLLPPAALMSNLGEVSPRLPSGGMRGRLWVRQRLFFRARADVDTFSASTSASEVNHPLAREASRQLLHSDVLARN